MITVENQSISIICDEAGKDLTFIDKKRGLLWRLDGGTRIYKDKAREEYGCLKPFRAEVEKENTLIVRMYAGEALINYIYRLFDGYVEVEIQVPETGEITMAALPGSFFPEGEDFKLVLPIMQGMLWDGRGPVFSEWKQEGGHLGFTMPLTGYIGDSGGLLFTAETQDDTCWWFGKDDTGRKWCVNVQTASLGSLRYERFGRIYFTDADIVAIAKTYRKKVMEQGRFRGWDEKIAERPGLERLFGSLMCFIGYCRDDIDYVAECRKLRDYGFDRALVYPCRFNTYHDDILMGGRPAIALDAERVRAIKSLGYDVAPWTWINEALDDGTEKIRGIYRRDTDGKIIPNWAIDSQQWNLVCTSFMEKIQEEAVKNTIPDMTWDHYDVLACATLGECYASDHRNHHGHPLSRTEDRKWIKRALLAGQAGYRAVSSENFNDAYSTELDFGSVKAWPQYGEWPFWPIPLTMLVYHDSMIHSWWEVHNYNNPWHNRTIPGKLYEYGGGRVKPMAALDALMGCPPDVFPFGAQYCYTGKGAETFLYKFRFEDPEVQLALREALPVAGLHRRVGKLEMVHFKILSEDGYVQETAFSDGTRVIANFSGEMRGIIPDEGHRPASGSRNCIAPESWNIYE